MSGHEDLIRRALSGLRVVEAAGWLLEALDGSGGTGADPAVPFLADLMVRHAESAERAATALRLGLHREHRQSETGWGDN